VCHAPLHDNLPLTEHKGLPQSASDHDQIVDYTLHHSRSKATVMVIMNLIAKFPPLYTTTLHYLSQLSMLLHTAYYYIQIRHGDGEREEVGSVCQL